MSKKPNHRIILAALLIVSGALMLNYSQGLDSSVRTKQSTAINLLHGYNWSSMAGVSPTQNGVLVSGLDRNIVQQDGSGGQPNPPVNLAGPRVIVSGDLNITTTMRSFGEGDSLRIYGGVPIIYDEWRFEPPSLELRQLDGQLQINIWDGSALEAARTKTFKLATGQIKSLSIYRHANKVTVSVNGRSIGSINAHAVFAGPSVYFGLDSKTDWLLTGLTVQGPSGPIVKSGFTASADRESKQGLQSQAQNHKHQIKIGAAVALNPLVTDGNYRLLALSQFGIWTPENELKPQFVHPKPNLYDFKEADLLVNTALDNGIAVHGHTLVFGEANPRWMQTAAPGQRQQIMTDHITNVMRHYQGRVSEWDVINEPLSDNDSDYANGGDGLRRHIWYQAMGRGYIATALRSARAADPSAKLYINDYGLEADGDRWDALIELIKQLQSQNVPLDGVGFEAHIYERGDHVDPKVLQRHIKQLAELGLLSRISEIDVHGENVNTQSKQYNGVLIACLSEPSCTAYSSWGITDRYGSTTSTDTYPLEYGNDLLWSSAYKPKPAYSALLQTLHQTDY